LSRRYSPIRPGQGCLDHFGLNLLDFQQVSPLMVDQQVEHHADFKLRFQVDAVVVFGAHAVACLLSVLAHQDYRRLNRG
jgi:hypothetical protein